VLWKRRVVALRVAAQMRGDPSVLEEAFDRRVRHSDHDVTYERVRHAVVVPIRFHVVVDADLRFEPFGVLVARRRQRFHRRPVDQLERLGATPRQFLERPPVELDEELCDRGIELTKREELTVAQAREDPPLHHEHTHLHGSLVFRAIRPGRQNGCAVVTCTVHVSRGRLRLIATSILDRSLKVVRDPKTRNRAEELQHPDVGADPVRQRLRPRRFRIRVFRGAQRRDENLGGEDLTTVRVDHRHGVAAVVDEHLLAGAVHLTHRAGERSAVFAVALEKLAVLVRAFAVRRRVLFPQQLQRHTLALEFLVHQRIVGLRIPAARRRLGVQLRLEPAVVQFRRQRPGEALPQRPLHSVRHRPLGHAGRRRDSLVA